MKTFTPFYENGTGRFIGPIQLDFFKMRKYVIPNVEMVVQLFRRDPKAFILYRLDPTKVENFKVVVERAYLHVKRVKLHDASLAAVEQRLLSAPALYNFNDTFMKPIIVPENVMSVDVNILDGLLPSRLEIVHLMQRDFTGPLMNNPFNFSNYQMKNVTLEKNGMLVSAPYQCDFNNNNYVRMFLDYFKNSGCSLDSAGMSEISYENYANYYTIMSFNLERFDECGSTLKSTGETGSLRLKIEYDSNTAIVTRPLVILCLLRFNRTIKLNAQRLLLA
jgi:hypothetical protein